MPSSTKLLIDNFSTSSHAVESDFSKNSWHEFTYNWIARAVCNYDRDTKDKLYVRSANSSRVSSRCTLTYFFSSSNIDQVISLIKLCNVWMRITGSLISTTAYLRDVSLRVSNIRSRASNKSEDSFDCLIDA